MLKVLYITISYLVYCSHSNVFEYENILLKYDWEEDIDCRFNLRNYFLNSIVHIEHCKYRILQIE